MVNGDSGLSLLSGHLRGYGIVGGKGKVRP